MNTPVNAVPLDTKQFKSPEAVGDGTDMMVTRMEEMKRREDAFAGSGGGATAKPADGKYEPKRRFKDVSSSNQRFVLFNISSVGQRPINDRPACRILGYFATKEEATAHAKQVVLPALPECALHVAEVGKKVLLCNTLERQQNEQYVMSKIRLLDTHLANTRDRHSQEFNENREKRQKGKVGLSAQAKRRRKTTTRAKALEHAVSKAAGHCEGQSAAARIEDAMPNSMADSTDKQRSASIVRDVPAACCLRSQSVAVVTFISDSTGSPTPEPAVIFWHAFGSADDARDYIETAAKRKIREVHMDVVEMYEWLFPEDVDTDQITEYFRQDELTKIMNQKKANPGVVADFEAWCEEEKIDAPKTEFVVNPETGETTISAIGEVASLYAVEKDADGNERRVASRNVKTNGGIRVAGSDPVKRIGSTLDAIGNTDDFPEDVAPDAV